MSARYVNGLILQGGPQAEFGTPVEFDEGRFAAIVNRPETMDSKGFNHPQRTGMVRWDIIHITICMDSGVSEM